MNQKLLFLIGNHCSTCCDPNQPGLPTYTQFPWVSNTCFNIIDSWVSKLLSKKSHTIVHAYAFSVQYAIQFAMADGGRRKRDAWARRNSRSTWAPRQQWWCRVNQCFPFAGHQGAYGMVVLNLSQFGLGDPPKWRFIAGNISQNRGFSTAWCFWFCWVVELIKHNGPFVGRLVPYSCQPWNLYRVRI